MRTFDDLRADHPTAGFAIYAYDPAGPVTLEALEASGATYTMTRPTLRELLETLYPDADPPGRPLTAEDLLA